MRIRISALIVFFLLCIVVQAVYAEDAEKPAGPSRPRMAVVPFDSKATHVQGLAEALCEQFSTVLVNCGRFDVFERRQMEAMMKEQGIGASGMVDPVTAVQIGKVTGCQLIGCGTIMDLKADVEQYEYKGKVTYSTKASATVNYKVLDAETGQIWKQATVTLDDSEIGQTDQVSLVRNVALATAAAFVKQLHPALKGKVIKVDETGIIVNLGSAQGVCAETEFTIGTLGKEIIDPDTGDVLGYEQGTQILARPIKDKIQAKLCYIVPGYWKQVTKFPLIKRWEWRPDAVKIKDVKTGDEVRSGVPQHAEGE